MISNYFSSDTNFSSISLQMADFSLFFWSQILRGTFCNFVAMATAQNLTNWFDLQNVSLKSESLSLIP